MGLAASDSDHISTCLQESAAVEAAAHQASLASSAAISRTAAQVATCAECCTVPLPVSNSQPPCNLQQARNSQRPAQIQVLQQDQAQHAVDPHLLHASSM